MMADFRTVLFFYEALKLKQQTFSNRESAKKFGTSAVNLFGISICFCRNYICNQRAFVKFVELSLSQMF